MADSRMWTADDLTRDLAAVRHLLAAAEPNAEAIEEVRPAVARLMAAGVPGADSLDASAEEVTTLGDEPALTTEGCRNVLTWAPLAV
jgi:hypothetical protein